MPHSPTKCQSCGHRPGFSVSSVKDQNTAARSVTVEHVDTSRIATDISGEIVDEKLTVYIYGDGQRIVLDALGALHFRRHLDAFLNGAKP